MKCDKCKQNEANFYYRETINGRTTERHLCADCAQEEGLTAAFDWRGGGLFGELFDEPFGGEGSLLGDFFGGGMLPRFARTMLSPMTALPRVEIGMTEPEVRPERSRPASEAEASIPEDAGAELKLRRELQALKLQLDEAVKNEDYEKAAGLRDRIRALEKK